MAPDGSEVRAGREPPQERLVERHASPARNRRGRHSSDDARVDALAALDVRDDAQHRILELASPGLPSRAAVVRHRRAPRPWPVHRRRTRHEDVRRAASVLSHERTRRLQASKQVVQEALPRGTTASRPAPPPGCRRGPGGSNGASRSSASSMRARGAVAAGGPTACANGRRACASGSRHVCWMYSAAPWSMSQGCPSHVSTFGLRAVRSMLVTSASNHTMSAESSRGGPGADPRPEGEGTVQEAQASVDAHAPLEELADLRVGFCASELRRHVDDRETGTGRPSTCPMDPATSSAMSAPGPWPAPRNLTTHSSPSAVSTTAGSEPPSRSGVA